MVGPFSSSLNSNDLLLRTIIGVAFGLAMFYAILALFWGPGSTIVVLTWYVPTIIGFLVLAALSIAFLAFGRYRVLCEPTPFWIGTAFISYALVAIFYALAFPGLLPDGRGFVARLPNTSIWILIFLYSLLFVFLLAAAVVPWPRPGIREGRWWFRIVISTLVVIAVIASSLATFEQILPVLIADGVYTALYIGWQFTFMAAFGAGALFSTYRYRQTGNLLLGYVALLQVALIFYWLALILSERRYDFWWYWSGPVVIGGFSAMLFGLLSEYVLLYRREREKARELAALQQVTDPSLGREGLEPLLQNLLERIVAIMNANAGAILLLDPTQQELVLRCGVGIPAEQAVSFRAGIGENFARRIHAQQTFLWVRDAQADPSDWSPYLKTSGVKGIVGAPMRIGEEVIGVIHVDFLAAREFSPQEKRLLEVAAERAALAIYQARLLEEAERRAAELQAILDNMVDGVFVCDVEGRITLVNESGARLLGTPSPEEVKRTLAEFPDLLRLRHLDGTAVTYDELPLARALAGETVLLEDQIVLNLRTQRDMYVRASAAPIRDESGKIIGALEVARDVTELTELDRLKDQFIAVAAHELKTPVAIMKGYAQALLRTAEDLIPTRRRMLDAINRGSDHIDRIVRDLLDISQLQLGQLELTVEKIDLPELVAGVVDRMALMTTKHQIRVIRADPVVVQGDRDRLEQVVINLLDNAVRYSPAGGDIEVGVAVQDHEAVVSVKDYGVGIPEDKQSRIFQRFFRAHTGTPYDYGGMGVGLYISKEIVNRHGGKIWFESEEGQGSTFYFSLPLA